MCRWLFLAAVLAPLPGMLAPADDKKDSPFGIPLPSGANIKGDTKVDLLVNLTLDGVEKDAIVFWDVTPKPPNTGFVEVFESDCENRIVFTGPPGEYVVKARGVSGKKKFSYQRTVEITGGAKPPVPPVPPVPPPVPPNPLPPVPPVPPEPVGPVAYFVVVEDTEKSQSWRGDILASPVVQAAYHKLQGVRTDPVHRLISVHSVSQTPEVVAYIKEAQGKELPWIWLLDKDKKVLRNLKVPQTPDEFAKLILPPGKDEPRRMGNKIPPEGKFKYAWKRFGATPNVPMIPRSEWKEISLAAYLPPVKDQDGIGACNAFATVEAVEACRKQAGLKYVRLSPGYLYGNINDGVDQGSLLEDGLAWMTTNGTCETALIGDLDWRAGRRRPVNAVENAKNYKVLEAYLCPNFEAMASALQQGFFIVEGLLWYDNFNPDRDGWLPARGVGNYGGHALCGYGLAQRNGTWGIRTRNSWSSSWGVGGNCVIPESLFGRDIGGFWAVRAVTATPTDFSLKDVFNEEPGVFYHMSP